MRIYYRFNLLMSFRLLVFPLLLFFCSAVTAQETPKGSTGDNGEKDQPQVYEIELDTTSGIDQTGILQRQINAVPDGTPEDPTIIRFPKGRFWTEGELTVNPRGENGIINIRARKNLVIEGDSTVFYTKAPATPFGGNVNQNRYSKRRHFRIHGSQNILVKNIIIEGSNVIEGKLLGTAPETTPGFWKGGPDNGSKKGFPGYRSYWEFEHGFDIINSQNITIENSKVYGVWGDGVYIGQSTTNPSENIILRNLHLKFTGRQGIAVSDARKILIDSVRIEKGRRSGIDLEPFHDGGFANEVEISNSRIEVQLTPFAAGGRGDVSDIYIHNNEFSGSGHSVYCRTSNEKNPTIRRNWRFIDNTRLDRFGSSAPVMKFGWTENITIRGNKDNYSGKYPIGLSFCKNVEVIDNEFEGGNQIRIYKTEEVRHRNNNPELEILNNG